MIASEAIRDVMSRQGYKQNMMAKELGITTASVANALYGRTMKTDTVIKYLKPLGYGLAVVPVDSHLPDGSILLESSVPEITVDLDDPNLMLG